MPGRSIAVAGQWHLGTVIAACLADVGYDVVGLDPNLAVVEALRNGIPAVAEPGLAELVGRGIAAKTLRFETIESAVLDMVEIVWVAFDTPVDEDDRADSEWVIDQALAVLARAPQVILVIVSSQLPVGSVAALERGLRERGRTDVSCVSVPENLRLGQAISTFTAPDRFIVGARTAADLARAQAVLAPFDAPIESMGVESGEMTKHAINGFLAMSVAYINEIASICEQTGADAIEVGRGLRSERRIGPGAYLSPGDAFGGGTLARDLQFLDDLATSHGVSAELVRGTIDSNAEHRNWSRRTLARLLGAEAHESAAGLSGRQIAIWGLTYKPGTDTLRRSTAIELCRWLHAGGVDVRGYDPAISALPVADSGTLRLCESPLAALAGADALVVCTPWPQFAEIAPNAVVAAMAEPVVIDASGFLAATLEGRTDVRYARVGARRT